jgi:hypothetical protein
VTNAKFVCAMTDAHAGAPSDDRDLATKSLPNPQATAIVNMKTLRLATIVRDRDAAIGQHTIDVKDEQSNASRRRACCGRCTIRRRGVALGRG